MVLLAPLAALLAARLRMLSLAYFNAAVRMPRHSNFSSYEVKFADQIRNCEDAVLVETKGIALLACDPGRETWNTVMVRIWSNHLTLHARLTISRVTSLTTPNLTLMLSFTSGTMETQPCPRRIALCVSSLRASTRNSAQ